MTNIALIVGYILVFPTLSFSQIRLNGLKKLLEKADTVMVVSFYDPTYNLDEKTGKSTLTDPLWLRGRPNPVRVNEQAILSSAQIQQLSHILSKPSSPIREKVMCYDPHHLIIAIHEGKASHIELCFGCLKFRTSEDIELRQEDIAREKLVALSAFFKQLGFRYELAVFE